MGIGNPVLEIYPYRCLWRRRVVAFAQELKSKGNEPLTIRRHGKTCPVLLRVFIGKNTE
jgi:hypothetical protein